ncbi:endoplasmic reticulum lectin 1 [Diorhabda sublineata]|uniref:endoplasmic reticulum lectin 1 n=1 Tax=Diorhabda sublineata TaxID=1163346 RepID=UPI0024E0E71E|nr:endoplasmic reticulum lectin 1 [Diorhabda sublineata]
MKNTLIIFTLIWRISSQNDIRGFDDSIIYNINWPGGLISEDEQLPGGESIIVTSAHQEKYKCTLPTTAEEEAELEEKYDGPTALEILSPLFSPNTPCSFRLESYWSYQVCHGRKVRQYHEDRDGKTTRVHEYILGKWDSNYYEMLLERAKSEDYDKNTEPPVKKVDNVNLPYYEVILENGTECSINNNKPRITKVLYVCYIHGKHEIYSVDEPQTCVYEIIILSPLVCAHPRYKPKDSEENKINCVPIDGSYKMPYSLAKLMHDSNLLRKKSDLDRFKVELIKIEKETVSNEEPKPIDSAPVEDFLRGKNCLNGGTGWWKFEFCYGRSVEQYHMESDGRRISINLGVFNRKAHLDWIAENPHKRPKPVLERKQLSHLYSSGSVCEKTGKHRQTEVKLKCLQNPSSPNAVSLYLLEPKVCQYILGVESPLICDILSRADENGLVEISETEFEETDITTTVNIEL